MSSKSLKAALTGSCLSKPMSLNGSTRKAFTHAEMTPSSFESMTPLLYASKAALYATCQFRNSGGIAEEPAIRPPVERFVYKVP